MEENLVGAGSLPFDQFGFQTDPDDGAPGGDDFDFGDFAGSIGKVEGLSDQRLDGETEEVAGGGIGEKDDGVVSDDEGRGLAAAQSLQEREGIGRIGTHGCR